eukprot:251526-Rhodomonas_salina.2
MKVPGPFIEPRSKVPRNTFPAASVYAPGPWNTSSPLALSTQAPILGLAAVCAAVREGIGFPFGAVNFGVCSTTQAHHTRQTKSPCSVGPACKRQDAK